MPPPDWQGLGHLALSMAALANSWLLIQTVFSFRYAHVVGMTAQVSDVVVITRRMRRLTLIHSVTEFAFNILVLALALSINLVAGAMQ